MKVKTKNIKPNAILNKRNSIPMHIGTRLLFVTGCLLAVPMYIGIAIASEQPGSTETPQHPDVHRDLWQNRISVPERGEDKKYKNELWGLIEQIRSIQFEPKSQEPKPVPTYIGIEPAPIRLQQEPNETSLITKAPQEPRKSGQPEPDKELQYEPVSDQTLQMLENISQSATERNQLGNPLELAEILFRSGHLEQAAVFYEQALNRKDPNDVKDPALAQDRAWILFQIGNCLGQVPMYIGMPAAKKMYRQLIVEYPNSPWTDLAKAREKLIDWYLSEKPQTLIAME